MIEPTVVAAGAALILFDLPDHHVFSTRITPGPVGRHRTHQPFGCPSCGLIADRLEALRQQQLRDVPVVCQVSVFWSK